MEVWLGAVLMIDGDLLLMLRGPPAATAAMTGERPSCSVLILELENKNNHTKEVANYDALDY